MKNAISNWILIINNGNLLSLILVWKMRHYQWHFVISDSKIPSLIIPLQYTPIVHFFSFLPLWFPFSPRHLSFHPGFLPATDHQDLPPTEIFLGSSLHATSCRDSLYHDFPGFHPCDHWSLRFTPTPRDLSKLHPSTSLAIELPPLPPKGFLLATYH